MGVSFESNERIIFLAKRKLKLKNNPIKRMKLSDLIPHPQNPRKITEDKLAMLRKSLEEFGDTNIITWNKRTGHIVGGHQRIKIMEDLGITEAEVRVVDLPENKEKALMARLNVADGEWDFPALKDLITEIDLGDLDMDLTGFTQDEMSRLFGYEKKGVTEDDEVPDPPKEAITKTGDVWILGDHRMHCGSVVNPLDIIKVLDELKIDFIFTDPPYGVKYGCDNKKIRKEKGDAAFHWSKTRKNHKIEGDEKSAKELAEVLWRPAFKNMYENSKDDCSFYMTMCQGGDQMMMMMMSEHWKIKHELIWVKSSPVFSMGRLDYDYQHEPILFGWKLKHNFYGNGQFKKSVWEIPKPSRSDLHPTMKPIALIENALLNSSEKGDICFDGFLGSGSTLIACEKTGRKCYGMEIDPIYCDVIVKRWEKYTGKKAILSE